jgi:pimeloyl-ACP methyl ester carboxylesterase
MTATIAQIQPFNFGPPGRLLFGIFHPASAVEAPRASVLLCHAFGQEAVRADRLMRVLAERLARAGHAVLRFDLYGTGDSMGDDLDGDLEGWAHDVHQASRELRARSSAAQSVWIGMRLGATVALRAAQQAPDDLLRLILWDPVLDGASYLARLRARHVASLEEAFSVMPAPTPSDLARDPRRFSDEAIGFALSPLLREQLVALSLPQHRWPARPASIVVLTDPDDTDGRDLVSVSAADPGRVTVIPVRHRTEWTSATADNSALVPAAALMQLVQHAGAPV